MYVCSNSTIVYSYSKYNYEVTITNAMIGLVHEESSWTRGILDAKNRQFMIVWLIFG